jgi:HAD superfamily hydrolase (TIGR01509 family)
MKVVSHLLFDMDGLLLDTENAYTVVQQQIASRHGKEFTWALKSKMMGQKAIEAAQIFVTELNLEDVLTPEDLLIQREAALDEMFPNSQLLPGAERLLRHLKAHNIPFSLATSSHRRHFELKTTLHTELFSLFDHITTGDSISRGKPAPDIFLHAAEKWTSSPPAEMSQILVFEDAPSGVLAAKAAGMLCVMVPDPNLDTELHEGADEVLDSLLEFKPEKYGLPPFA